MGRGADVPPGSNQHLASHLPRAARIRRLAVRTVTILIVSLAAALVIFLPFAGRFLVAQDALERSDLILVLAGTRTERWLEGFDLYKEGWAPRIVLSPGMVDPIEAELQKRGVTYPREGDLARDAIVSLGVPADVVTVLPNGVDNTAAEAAALHMMFPDAKRIIVVTSPYHTRRTGFAFRREFKGAGVQVIVRSTRYSRSEPARWWRHRGDVRYIMTELPKYAAYMLGLGE
jgi:uncharacterized SAM-binding protein YcdF (DUF218 family)